MKPSLPGASQSSPWLRQPGTLLDSREALEVQDTLLHLMTTCIQGHLDINNHRKSTMSLASAPWDDGLGHKLEEVWD